MVGGLRSPSNRVPLCVIRARQVAILTVTRGVGSLSWCVIGSRRVLFMCDNRICESSGLDLYCYSERTEDGGIHGCGRIPPKPLS